MSRNIAFGGIGLLLLCSPFFAAAQSLEELQAQIQALLAQVAALQAQLSATSSSSAPQAGPRALPLAWCPNVNITQNLQLGSRDVRGSEQVYALQRFLAAYYDRPGADIVTGYFGAQTKLLVERFQAEYGLDVSGAVRVQTRAKLRELCGALANKTPITVMSPNGGELFDSGGNFSARWIVRGKFPAGMKTCINLTNQSTQANHTPFNGGDGTSHCVDIDASKEVQEKTVSGQLMDAQSLPLGAYKVRAFTYNNVGPYRAEFDVFDESDAPFTIRANASSSPALAITSFVADPSSILPGKSSRLSWTARGVSDGGCYLYADPGTPGASITPRSLWKATGTFTVSPNISTTYTLQCFSSYKDGSPSDARSLTVNVVDSNVPSASSSAMTLRIWADTNDLVSGASTMIHWTSQNAVSCDVRMNGGKQSYMDLSASRVPTGALWGDTTYKLTCRDAGGKEKSVSMKIRVLSSTQLGTQEINASAGQISNVAAAAVLYQGLVDALRQIADLLQAR